LSIPSLSIGQSHNVVVSSYGPTEDNYNFSMVLWTTQGQPQQPFNGMALGSTDIYSYIILKQYQSASLKLSNK